MSRVRVLVAAAVLLVVVAVELGAQAVDTIVPASGSVVLRRLWFRRGDNPVGGSRYGSGIGSVGHLSSQEWNDFAVNDGGYWRIYQGGPALDTTAEWSTQIIDLSGAASPEIGYPVVGNFRGDGELLRGFATFRWTDTSKSEIRYTFSFYEASGGRLLDTPSVVIDPSRRDSNIRWFPKQMFAVDLDQDGADELVVANPGGFGSPGEVWIYRGGSSFGFDTPAVVVRDTHRLASDKFSVAIGSFDDDPNPDLLVAAIHTDSTRLQFWWGGAGTPWNWSTPDRTILLSDDGHPRVGNGIMVTDCDGDQRLDLVLPGPDGYMYLFRSDVAKNTRVRGFDLSDGDRRWKYYTLAHDGGYLNDSARRYAMVAFGTGSLVFLSGGVRGPDDTYEATFSFPDLVAQYTSPLLDVDGDGWDDFGMANPTYGFNRGIAVIAAGGPEIPRDSQSSSVIDVAVTGKQRAVSLWPNPVVEELHIAWRGDLRPMPSRFEIYDLSGVLVARGEADPSRGEVLWRCATAPAGRYLLRVSDAQGVSITSVPFIKE